MCVRTQTHMYTPCQETKTWNSFCVGLWLIIVRSAHCSHCECGWYITSITPQKKTDFLSSNSYQLQIASWLGMRHCAYFPLLVLGLGLTLMVSDLRHAVTVSVSSNGHQPCCVWETLCLWTPPSLLTLTFFLSPLPHIPWSPEEMLW